MSVTLLTLCNIKGSLFSVSPKLLRRYLKYQFGFHVSIFVLIYLEMQIFVQFSSITLLFVDLKGAMLWLSLLSPSVVSLWLFSNMCKHTVCMCTIVLFPVHTGHQSGYHTCSCMPHFCLQSVLKLLPGSKRWSAGPLGQRACSSSSTPYVSYLSWECVCMCVNVQGVAVLPSVVLAPGSTR